MKPQQGDNRKSAIHLILEHVAAATISKQQYNTILEQFLWRRTNNQTYRHCENNGFSPKKLTKRKGWWASLCNGSADNQQTTIQNIRDKMFVMSHEIRKLGKATTGFRTSKLSSVSDNHKWTIQLYHEHTAAATTSKQQINTFWIRFLWRFCGGTQISNVGQKINNPTVSWTRTIKLTENANRWTNKVLGRENGCSPNNLTKENSGERIRVVTEETTNKTTIQQILDMVFVAAHEIRMLGKATTGLRISVFSGVGNNQKSTIKLDIEHSTAATTNKQQSNTFWIRFLRLHTNFEFLGQRQPGSVFRNSRASATTKNQQ